MLMRLPTLGGFFRLNPVSEVSQPASQWLLVAPANATPRGWSGRLSMGRGRAG
jgi:hypothetical protein